MAVLGLVLVGACDAGGSESEAPVQGGSQAGAVADPVGEPGAIDSASDGKLVGAAPLAGGDAGGIASPAADPAAPGTDPDPAPVEGGNGAQVPSGGDAVAVLLRAERAYDAARSMRADFIQDLTVPLLGNSQRSRGEIFHRKPDRFLMRFSDPAGDVVVADGRYVWLYYPSSDPRQVMRTSGEAGRIDLQREFLSNPTERFSATLEGVESVDGRPATALTLVPRTASPYRQVRIWVDAEDALVRRFEITESNDAVRRVELRNLRSNVTLADSLFAFTPPAGTQVFDQ